MDSSQPEDRMWELVQIQSTAAKKEKQEQFYKYRENEQKFKGKNDKIKKKHQSGNKSSTNSKKHDKLLQNNRKLDVSNLFSEHGGHTILHIRNLTKAETKIAINLYLDKKIMKLQNNQKVYRKIRIASSRGGESHSHPFIAKCLQERGLKETEDGWLLVKGAITSDQNVDNLSAALSNLKPLKDSD